MILFIYRKPLSHVSNDLITLFVKEFKANIVHDKRNANDTRAWDH